MERKTFSVIFYLRRARINRDGEAPIVMRITIDGMHADATIKKQSTRINGIPQKEKHLKKTTEKAMN
ncbi:MULTISPECIES: hypothetical protein [Sanguibacteroides]|uniref:hypothetical protein n=1 Tax=Sanguibacteroides TaxID=1635148 RepID=UPI000698C856|nr:MULTISPECIES: hypothetical protein [Sanguibacteroides]PXZ44026.1 hypothetical protein DMB45_08645 [Sanguibacteroides justesenii]